MILPFIDCITSWFAGCVIFVTLGFMANQANVSIGDVVEQGNFIIYIYNIQQ